MKKKIGFILILPIVAALFAGCGNDQTASEIAKFDQEEVAMLRQQIKDNNIDVGDEHILSTLRTRQQCRDIQTGWLQFAAGDDVETVADELAVVVESAEIDNQPDMKQSYQEMIDLVRLGDSTRLQQMAEVMCEGVS